MFLIPRSQNPEHIRVFYLASISTYELPLSRDIQVKTFILASFSHHFNLNNIPTHINDYDDLTIIID